MNNHQILDEPVASAEWDLLGMALYAERLAEYISEEEAQFTLGVYGQWGEGKTSFVNLLRDKLCPPVLPGEEPTVVFITFSAWPYATADDLWRALIKTITLALCGEAPKPPPGPATWRERLKTTALTVAVKKRPTPAPVVNEGEIKQKEGCRDLRSWANMAAHSGISKGMDEQLQINQQVAMMAMVRAGVEALSIVSPLVRMVRGFLGLKSEFDMTAVFHKEKTEVKEESIDSIQQLVNRGKALFDDIKGERRVYVFVDDLDRCLPDVALDLLEAIKNFLNVGLTFIVAADEALIGQGLRLRYKELINQSSGDMNKFIATKGREYFEKIIQFGVRVPPRTPEQAHHFITAQFPQWQPATDLIQTAIGTNPRRLKQYCNLLSYKRLVGDMPLSMAARDRQDRSVEAVHFSTNSPQESTTGQPTALIISGDRYQEILSAVSYCFVTNNVIAELSTLFLDVRIRLWRKDLPSNPDFRQEEIIQSTVDMLIDSFDDQGKNGLILFLEVLQEKAPKEDGREQIGVILNDLLEAQGQGEAHG